MRKFLMVVAVGLLVVAVAAPAMAIDFQFKGAYRWRLYSMDGFGAEGATVAASPFVEGANSRKDQGDLRFRPFFIVKDDNGKVESGLRFEIGDVIMGSNGANGPGGRTGADVVNMETKWAYIDVELPHTNGARLKGGLQGLYLPKGAILDDDFAAIQVYGKAGIAKYSAWWAFINEQGNNGTQAFINKPAAGPANDDIDHVGLKFDFDFGAVDPYVYGVYQHGTAFDVTGSSGSADGYWVGVGATGKVGIFNWDIDGIYGSAEAHGAVAGDGSPKKSGYFIDLGGEFPAGPVTIGLRAGYASGDKAGTANKNEDFPGVGDTTGSGSGVAGYIPKGSELFWNSNGAPYFGGGYTESPANTYHIGAYVTYYPVKALRLKVDSFFIGAPQKSTNFWTGKSMVGLEIAGIAEYTIATGVKIYGIAGVILTPGTGIEQAGIGAGDSIKLKDAKIFSMGVLHDF